MGGRKGDSGVDSIVVRVVEALARAEGVRAADLDWRLQNDLDPDALARLADHDGGPWQLHFRARGHDIRLDSGGTVEVDPGSVPEGADGDG
jgi:hypothetical protein